MIRILLNAFSIFLFFFSYFNIEYNAILFILGIIIIYQIYSLIKFVDITNKELARFISSIKYSDFSQSFTIHNYGSSFEELGNSFNNVIEKFQKTRSEKEENLRYLQTVMQHVGVGLISYNQDGKVEFINNSAKRLLKISHLKHLSTLDETYQNLGNQFLSITPGNKTTLKIVDDNDLIQLICYSTQFKMRNQIYTLLSLQNIQSELEEKEMEAWQKLIRVLTHEIMNSVTPISSLAGTVNIMLSKDDSEIELSKEQADDIKTAVFTIQKRSEGLIKFVENYRNLTKIPKPNFQIISLKSLFDRVKNLMQKEFENNSIEFSCDVEPETLELTADPEMFEQVLINLIINSIHALRGRHDPKIYLIGYLDERGKIAVKVIDNGPGINEDVQDKIFIPFFSTKRDGSGIGLSLSRQIIRSHGGSIRVNSKQNEGTTFTMRF
ncbi:MAG: hypothetical protein K9J16_14485 [Melioribacteraceae bacterium]|nr:hypothetical protein [Melioribacteraceae bacterium]MCF8356217.1 hypothetical protein [Melioribacteraceae bacterium]MCF8396478.1 hypothetical protein [Melioribacteraceae bacterium]MCF8420631.1 hypothetical protein [Melioribacteraceae bacterium]